MSFGDPDLVVRQPFVFQRRFFQPHFGADVFGADLDNDDTVELLAGSGWAAEERGTIYIIDDTPDAGLFDITQSAQATITVSYRLIDNATNKPISEGVRRAFASFDQTPQKYANERSARDAQNRAAKEVAQRLRLAIAKALATNDS